MRLRTVEIKENYLLKNLTTFRVGGKAEFFAEVRKSQDLGRVLEFAKNRGLPVLVLGGGSNMVVSERGFPGLVVRMINKGVSVIKEDENWVWLRVEAGEVWDDVVKKAVESSWWGIENLSHIPGSCGAVAVQNVGAYGQQVSDVMISVEVWHKKRERILELSKKECRFGYRESVFNKEMRGQMVIIGLTIKLNKQGKANLSYKDVGGYFAKKGIQEPNIKDIRQAIIEIRDKKYPFPLAAKGGSVGSFFKNQVMSREEFRKLIKRMKTVYGEKEAKKVENLTRVEAGSIKVPTAALLDICGIKNMKAKGVYVNPNQPLVLINNGRATADDVMELFRAIRREVYKKLGVILVNEPELIGFGNEEIEYYFDLH